MKKKLNIKKTALSVISVTLVFATVVSLVPAALASETRSLDYIETLKDNYSGGTLKVLEIAPSDTNGVMGYYVEGSEPSNDWAQKVAMYSTPSVREDFAKKEFDRLKSLGILSETAQGAPLYLEKNYNEFYPWELNESEKEKFSLLKLDGLESLDVPGTMKYAVADGTKKGEYSVSSEYVPAVSAYKNYFNFGEWRSTLEKTLRDTLGADFETKKFESSKILVPNKNDKTVTVFGSTEENWKHFTEINSGSLFYDLSTAYADTDYYTIEVDPDNGGTYILTFDVIADNGKGQFTVLPLTKEGKNISYSPNYSRQYWYRSEYVTSGHYEYQFTVPANSTTAKIQVRFDVDNLKASAIFSNVSIYQFNKNLFEAPKYVGSGSKIISEGGKITSIDNNGFTDIYATESKVKDKPYFVPCNTDTVYNLTYHTELSAGGGKSKAIIRGYDASGNIIDVIVTDVQKKSGTYSVNFNSGNAKHLAISFAVDATGITEQQTAVYSNISLTEISDYVTEEVEAKYRQEIPHLNIGDSGYEYDSSIFNFQSWYSSGSYGRGEGSENSSAVFATENKGIITITGRGETVTRDTYKGADNVYYIPVTEGDVYRLTYDVESSTIGSGEAKIENAIKLVYCNENKNKISEETVIKKADGVGITTFTHEFTVGSGCKWLQIGFCNTAESQKNAFYNISLCRKNRPKAFYYDANFTLIDAEADDSEISDNEAIYEPEYKFLGKAEGFEFAEGKKYYYFDRDKTYKEVTDPEKLTPTDEIYERTGLYRYIGNYNEISLQKNTEYYIGRINYGEYADVRDTSTLGTGSVYYLLDEGGNYVYGGTVDEKTVFDPEVTYYVKIATVSESYDANHPYWVDSETFIEVVPGDEERPLFKRIDNGYTYVGKDSNGNYLGEYNFDYQPDGTDTVRMTTDEVYYEGGYVNNNWFKLYVLNCNEEQMKNVGVSVTTVTPEYLNNLDEEELVLFLQSYELFVFSYGGADEKAEFNSDISEAVAAAISDELNDAMGEGDYPIPRAVDSRIIDKGPARLKALCAGLCENIDSLTGGVSEFTYKFYRFFDVKSFVNNKFTAKFENSYYDESTDAYYDVFKELNYENFIRGINGNKYGTFDEWVSEANCFRYILNFRGQRIRKFKDTIRILEIQPYTNKSDLLDESGKFINQTVKDWFSSTGDNLLYVDENGNTRNVNIVVTTMAAGELAAKNESITENYDMIYVGASFDGLTKVSNTATAQKLDENGHIIPDYKDDNMDGMFYTNTGDKYPTEGSDATKRANLAGLVGTDYSVIGTKIFGTELIENGIWLVDASTCELRKSGNDITQNISDQIADFASAGKPVVYADELVENEFTGTISAKVTGKVIGWADVSQRGDRKINWDDFKIEEKLENKPIMQLTAEYTGDTLPEGVYPYFTWHYIGPDNTIYTFDESNDYEGDAETWLGTSSGHKINYRDVEQDTVNKKSTYTFIIDDSANLANNDFRRLGKYYVTVTFRFKGVKYKGLKDFTDANGAKSNTVNIGTEKTTYRLEFLNQGSLKWNMRDVSAKLSYVSGAKRMPCLEDGSNFIYEYKWTRRTNKGSGYDRSYKANPDQFYPENYASPGYMGDVTTRMTLTGDRQHAGYKLQVWIDPDDVGPTLEIIFEEWQLWPHIGETQELSDEATVTYYNATANDDGVPAQAASGIALNEERFDSSSYMFDCMRRVFNSEEGTRPNVFSASLLTSSKSKEDYRYKLLKYANLSAPEIIVNNGSQSYTKFIADYGLNDDWKEIPSYPNELPNNSRILEFEFAITNNTDESPLKTKYDYAFYIDNNADGKFSESEKTTASVIGVKTASVNGGLNACTASKPSVYKLTKVFPQSVSGIIPWKLVITKIGDSKTHISYTDYAYVQPDEMTVVRALQILPNDFKSTYRARGNIIDIAGVITFRESELDGDLYTGSVFLSDIFLNEEVRKIREDNGTNVMLDRVIIYPDMMPTDAKEKSKIYSREYWQGKNDIETGKPVINGKQRDNSIAHWKDEDSKYHPERVLFFVGNDFILDIAFTCIDELNGGLIKRAIEADQSGQTTIDDEGGQGSDAEETVYGTLTSYDMLILGFGDNWGKHGSRFGDGLYTAKFLDLEAQTYCGFQQGTALAIEEFVDSGRPVLFCHDTASMSNNFINYAVNEAFNSITLKLREIGEKINKWWDELWGNEHEVNEKDIVTLHTSRVKQGYFNNVATRDSLGLDRYGITKNIKDKLMKYQNKPNHYQIVFDDASLKAAYNYSLIYDDTSTTSSPGELDLTTLDAAKRATIEKKIQDYVDSGYAIAYTPTKGAKNAKTKIECYAQGYSDFIIDRNKKGLGDLRDSQTITQVNSGQITSYPYDVNIAEVIGQESNGTLWNTKKYSTLQIEPTHEQVYQVSLHTDANGDGTTVWYCYDSSSSTKNTWSTYRNNAMNAYYIYTRKNVTYTGAGHTNVFSIAEAKLFLNTIVASYRAGSDKPVMNFVKENGIDTERYKVFVSYDKEASNGEMQTEIENDKIYFKINDVAVDSDIDKTLSVKFSLDSKMESEISGITPYAAGSETASSLGNLKMNTVYNFELPESLINELEKDDVSEITIYAQATLEYTMAETITQKSDTVSITIRKLGLHSIV